MFLNYMCFIYYSFYVIILIANHSIFEVFVLEYITVKQAAERWGITPRRVRVLCAQGKIPGVVKKKGLYNIPINAIKPIDGRLLRGKNISQEYFQLFSQIDALKEQLNKRRPLTQGEIKRLQEEFLIEFTYNSNAIEGSTLTLKETAMVLKGITIDEKPLREHLEAVGNKDAFMYIQQLVSDKRIITERIIKEIHSLVLMDRPFDKGVYRRLPVRIMDAAHEPPQPYLVPVQMEQLIADFAKTKLHPIESAALFHLKFEGIHPFIDGNGRTGRLLLNFMLMQHGYLPINVKFSDRKKYYNCFDDYYKNNDAKSMINMVTKYLKEQLEKYLSLLQ